MIVKNLSPEFFVGKMETFLTCRAVAAHLTDTKTIDEREGKFFEDLALQAIHRTLSVGLNFSDAQLLISELPNILIRNYPVVEDIRNICLKIIPSMIETIRLNITGIPQFYLWRDIYELETILNLLKVFDGYTQK